MAVKKTYRINLRNYGSPPAVMVSQYDEGYAIAFEIFDGPLPVLASSLSGYTFKLKGRQPGNPPFLAYEFEGTLATALNAVVSFEIDTTMTARAGKGTAELVILDEENDVKFASVNFAVYTEPAAVPDGSIDADVQRAMEIAEEVQEIVDTAAAEVKGEAEAWAVGQRDGVDVPSTDPAYENNAKFYAEQAAQIAEDISGVTGQVATNTSDISDLKEDLSQITGAERITQWTVGKYILTSETTVDITNLVSSANYSCAVIECTTGDVFTITGTGGSGGRLWCFIDSNGNSLLSAESSETVNEKIIKAPQSSAYLVLNVRNIDPYVCYIGTSVNHVIDGKISDAVITLESGYRFSNGSYIKTDITADSTYRTALLSVEPHDIINAYGRGSQSARTWATCDDKYNVIRTATAQESAVFDNYSIEILPGEKYFCFNSAYFYANRPILVKQVYGVGLDEKVSNVGAKNSSNYKKSTAVSQGITVSKNGHFLTKAYEKDSADYARITKIGGSVWQWSQVNRNTGANKTVGNVIFTNNSDGTWTITGQKTAEETNVFINTGYSAGVYLFTEGHKYLFSTGNANISTYGVRYGTNMGLSYRGGRQIATAGAQTGSYDYINLRVLDSYDGNINVTVRPICVDLTEMFGSGHEPTIHDDDLLTAIEIYASNNPNVYNRFVETVPTGVKCGNDIQLIPENVKMLPCYGGATKNLCNYISYDEWVEDNVARCGWRYHKNVGRLTLNGTQRISTINFNPTNDSSAWIYYNVGEKPQPILRGLADIVSDVFTTISYMAMYNGEVTNKPVIAAYTNNTGNNGMSVRVPVSGLDTVEKVNAYMANNPATVLFELDEPEIYDLTDYIPNEILLSRQTDTIEFLNTSGIAICAAIDFYHCRVKGNAPMLTIIDDDGDIHFLTDVVPMILRKNVTISSAVTPHNVGKTGTLNKFMSYEEIDECNDAGAEILCHTYDHPDDTDVDNLDAFETTHKYLRGLNILKRHGYHASDILVYTSSTGNYEFYHNCAAKVFKCGIKIGGETLNFPDSNKYALARYRCDYTSSEGRTDWNYDDLRSFIDLCATEKGWMIWMFHTSNRIYRRRVELNGDGTVKHDQEGNCIPMVDEHGDPVYDIEGEYPTMGTEVYIPMLEDLIDYARDSGVEIATAEHAYDVYFGQG